MYTISDLIFFVVCYVFCNLVYFRFSCLISKWLGAYNYLLLVIRQELKSTRPPPLTAPSGAPTALARFQI